MNKLLAILILFYFFGCSRSATNVVNADGQTVEVDESVEQNTTENSEIVIENNQYGPQGTSTQADGALASKKSSVVAAIMPISHFSLYAYVGLLKGLEYADTKIRMFNGTSMGSYFAAFVSGQGTSSLLEWNILKVYGEDINFEYKAKDLDRFDQVFSITSEKKIEDLTHLLFVSTYNQKNKNIEFFNKGNLLPILNKSFMSGNDGSLVFPVNVLKKRGADKVVAFVFDEQDFFKSHGRENLIGQYNKMMSRVLHEKQKLDYYCKIKVNAAKEKQIIIKQVFDQVVKCALEINKMVEM